MVKTTPTVSKVHAANFKKEIESAGCIEALKAAAERHGKWLLKSDAERLRQIYALRLQSINAARKGS